MPKLRAPLTDAEARHATAGPDGKPRKLAAGKGLFLLVTPTAKLWRFKYRVDGKEKLLSLGSYPEVGIAEARRLRDTERAKLDAGRDPAAERRAGRLAAALAQASGITVRELAEEFMAKKAETLAPATIKKNRWLLDSFLVPYMGRAVVQSVKPPDVLMMLRKVESNGARETARRLSQFVGQVWRYAVATGRAESDPTPSLRGALLPTRARNFAAITDADGARDLMRSIASYPSFTTRSALQLLAYTFVRPGELRAARWAEFDLDGAEPTWIVPAERMNSRAPHLVPLARQCVAILRELQPLTGRSEFVFPSARGANRCMSNAAMLAALRRMGYDKTEMTAHGFRALASSLLNAQHWEAHVIERQLAHAERSKTHAVDHRHQYVPERRRMMQAWADYLDGLAKGADVVPIGSARQA